MKLVDNENTNNSKRRNYKTHFIFKKLKNLINIKYFFELYIILYGLRIHPIHLKNLKMKLRKKPLRRPILETAFDLKKMAYKSRTPLSSSIYRIKFDGGKGNSIKNVYLC